MKIKKGFTLMELLAVIAILAILSIVAIPNAMKAYNRSVLKTMENQEMQASAAAELFVKDYCNDDFDNKRICPGHFLNNNYLCLSEIQEAKYIKKISYKSNECTGIIYFYDGKTPQTYLFCNGYNSKDIPNGIDPETYCNQSGEAYYNEPITSHVLNIRYNGNGGVWAGSSSLGVDSNGNVTQNGSILQQSTTYGNYVGSSGGLSDYNNSEYINFTKEGYIVPNGQEWYAINNNVKTYFNQANNTLGADAVATAGGCDLLTSDCTITLYVNWIEDTTIHNLSISYNGNGGTWAANSESPYAMNGEGMVVTKSNNAVFNQVAAYGGAVDVNSGLFNYNDENTIKFLKSGYSTMSEFEWYTINGEEKHYFNQDDNTLTAEALAASVGCNLRIHDCSVTLYVNWEKNKLFLTYNGNGGEWGNPVNDVYTANAEDGYVRYKAANEFHEANDIAAWMFEYGESMQPVIYNGGWIKFVKTGYSAIENKEYYIVNDETNTITVFHQNPGSYTAQQLAAASGCDLSVDSCMTTLYVNWASHQLHIQYNGNGGNWGSSSTIYAVDDEDFVYRISDHSRDIKNVFNNSENTAVVDASVGLHNYDNSTSIYFSKSGYTVPEGQEWCDETGTKCYSDSDLTLKISTLATQVSNCDITERDCTVELYVNWKAINPNFTCTLKQTGRKITDKVTWDSKPSTATSYQIDIKSSNPTSYSNNTSVDIGNRIFYGHIKNSSGQTAKCVLKLKGNCFGATPSIHYKGSCTCYQNSDYSGSSTNVTISDTTANTCAKYCQATDSTKPYGKGTLTVITQKKCDGRNTNYKCPGNGCYGNDKYCHVYTHGGAKCPSAYPYLTYLPRAS